MAKRDWQAERLRLFSEEHQAAAYLAELESEAGITGEVERAMQGHFIPVSATNPDLADDEDAWDHDYARKRIRDLYFSVTDDSRRIELIRRRSEVWRLRQRLADFSIGEARDAVDRERSRSPLMPLLTGAIVAVAFVIGGYRYFGTVGLVAGAVAGVLIGQGISNQSKAERAASLVTAESELRGLVQLDRENSDLPEFFSEREAATGIREPWFDDVSAVERRASRASAALA